MKLLDVVFEAVVDISEVAKMTQDEFINKAEIKQGKGRYDYSQVNYVNNNTPITVICHNEDFDGNEHGEFKILPRGVLSGRGCLKCVNQNMTHTKDKFIKKAEERHGIGRYDYSEIKYVNNSTDVMVVCHKKDKNGIEHGPFMVRPSHHTSKSGVGCSKCNIQNITKTKEDFIDRARKKHGEDRYDYNQVDYINRNTKVIIVCHKKNKDGKEHGPFLQTPASHLYTSGCPICQESSGEREIRTLLDEYNIKYITEFKHKYCNSIFKSSVNKKCISLSFDFYLPSMKTIIEYDGEYHFEKHYKGKNDSFMSQVLNDREKNNFTKLKGIKLIRISYLDKKNIADEIINGLKSEEQLYLSTNYPRGKGWDDDNFQPTTKFIKKYT